MKLHLSVNMLEWLSQQTRYVNRVLQRIGKWAQYMWLLAAKGTAAHRARDPVILPISSLICYEMVQWVGTGLR